MKYLVCLYRAYNGYRCFDRLRRLGVVRKNYSFKDIFEKELVLYETEQATKI